MAYDIIRPRVACANCKAHRPAGDPVCVVCGDTRFVDVVCLRPCCVPGSRLPLTTISLPAVDSIEVLLTTCDASADRDVQHAAKLMRLQLESEREFGRCSTGFGSRA